MGTSGGGATSAAPRLVWMDTLRGVAVLLVVYTHAISLSPVPPPEAFKVVDHVVSPFRIPALMFLSGMLLPASLAKPRDVYLRGKVSRVLWPYLLWSLVIWVATSFGAPAPNPLVELFVDPTSPMWFVGYLFVFYVAVLLVPPAARTWLLLATVGALLVAAPGVGPHPSATSNAGGLDRLLFTFVCFLAGDLLARHQVRWLPALTRFRVSLLCALLALPALVASVAGQVVRYQAVYLVSTLAGILAAIPLVARLSRTSAGRYLAVQGRRSIVFYVTGFPAQLVAWHVVFGLGVRDGLVIMVVNLVAGLVAGLVMAWLRSRSGLVDHLFDLHLERWGRRATGPGVHRPVPAAVRAPGPVPTGEA